MAVGVMLAPHWRFLGIVCLALGFALRVDAVEVYTTSELFVENGTRAKLPCTFKSSEVVSSRAFVTWDFLPDSGGKEFTILHFSGGATYGADDRFKDRITWDGDLNKKDGSVYIENVQFKDNGTYICTVKNPPDVSGSPARLLLRVVAKENLPVYSAGTLAGIVVGAVAGFLLLVGLIVGLVICMNNSSNSNSNKNYSGCSTTESLMSPVKQTPKKSSSETQGLVNNLPTGSHQGPVIYAQLDHSGGTSNQIIKSESVVYADILKN